MSNELIDVLNVFDSFGLRYLVKDVTRPMSGTCLDNVVSSIHVDKCHAKVISTAVSDHDAIMFTANIDFNHLNNDCDRNLKYVRIINDFNVMNFIQSLKNINWIHLYSIKKFDCIVKYFFDYFYDIIDNTIPISPVSYKYNRKSISRRWYTDELRIIKNNCMMYYDLYVYYGLQECKNKYIEMKRKYKKSLELAKKNYYSSYIRNSSNKSKSSWNVISELVNTNSKSRSTSTNLNCDEFNEFFVDKVHEIVSHIPKNSQSLSFLHKLDTPKCNFEFTDISVEDVFSAIMKLNNSACTDVNEINARIFKLAAPYICEPLTYVYNCCIKEGCFPDTFKYTKVIPVYKRGDKTAYENYRPISIIPIAAKIFEILLCKQIVTYFETNSLLNKSQFGFRNNLGTINAITFFLKLCYEKITEGKKVASRFFDLTRAFDTVSHSTLLQKLKFYGFQKKSIEFLSSYFNNRHQATYFNGKSSNYLPVEHGVPQGSILGPVFFIIYINDLPSLISDDNLKPFLYADDLAIVISENNENMLSNELKFKSLIIHDWCNANKLSINKEKTMDLQYKFNTVNVHSVKFLGIYIDSDLGWSTHVNYISNKISTGLFMLRFLRSSVTKDILMKIYYAHVYSHISYGILFWGNHPSASRIFILQKRAVRIICGVSSRYHCKPLFTDLGILTLPSLYVLHCLMYVKDNLDNFDICSNIHSYSTRNCSNLYNKKYKHTKIQNSYIAIASKMFNCLPLNLRMLPKFTFRRAMRHTLTVNPLYCVNDFFNLVL